MWELQVIRVDLGCNPTYYSATDISLYLNCSWLWNRTRCYWCRHASQMHRAALDMSRHFKCFYLTHKVIIKHHDEVRKEALDKADTASRRQADHHDCMGSTINSLLISLCGSASVGFVASSHSTQFTLIYLNSLFMFIGLTFTWPVLFNSNTTNDHYNLDKHSFTLLLLKV